VEHESGHCAAIPLTQISVVAWRCHYHQAWCARVSAHTQTGEEVLTDLHSEEVSFGPFDGWEDVYQELAQRLWKQLSLER
jgi:hypothetical protein